jgi:repressor LexA
VLGTIAAGVPMLAQEDIIGEECVRLNDAADFCLRVKGDSMANARIYDGDIVFVRRQETVESGEIAVVMVGDEEATLKRFYNVNGTIFLRPENSKYEEQVITKKDRKNVKILGKAVYFKGEVR